jgi:hypothetical protein
MKRLIIHFLHPYSAFLVPCSVFNLRPVSESKTKRQAGPEVKIRYGCEHKNRVDVEGNVDGGAGKFVVEAECAFEGERYVVVMMFVGGKCQEAATANIPFQAGGAGNITVPVVLAFDADGTMSK